MSEKPLPSGLPFKSQRALPKEGAFRASRPPMFNADMIPTGTTLVGKIVAIRESDHPKFKTPKMELELEGGMLVSIPLWASIQQVIGKTPEEQQACVGHQISLTKYGTKMGANGKEFQVFDVVVS